MKTTISKSTMKEFRGAYIAMQDEVNARRAKYQDMRRKAMQEEEDILEEMFRTAENLLKVLGREPTANEIAIALDGTMSRQEVVGQLMVAAGEHCNGATYPKPTKNARHTATKRRKGKVSIDHIITTRKFAEVDDKGELVKGGLVIKKTTCRNGYRVQGA